MAIDQYVLKLTDANGQPLSDAGTVVVSELFTGETAYSSAVDARGFSAGFPLLYGVLYGIVTQSTTVPKAIVQPSTRAIIIIDPAAVARAAAIVGYGDPSAATATDFTFTQVAPATTWTIAHTLGRRPSVTTIDDAGERIDGEVTYPDLATVLIDFSQPIAGIAYLV